MSPNSNSFTIAPETDNKYCSVEDYRRLEARSSQRHDYRDGEVVSMRGGSATHNKIILCLAALLMARLEDDRVEVFASDLRLWIPRRNMGTYPDLMVVDGEVAFNGDRTDEILNPTTIVEVLSPSTEAYDRGDKFRHYRSIPSFCEYLLVSQTEPYIEQFCRQTAGEWQLQTYEGLESAIALHCFDIDLPLEEIYRRVKF